MLGLTKRWTMRDGTAVPAGHGSADGPGQGAIRPRPLAQRILAARGLVEPAAIDAFLEPRLQRLHEPAAMPGIDAAATRIVAAVRDREPIVIYGDYDVDGMTATAILMRVLRCLDPQVDVRSYVPHRLEEGYGLNAAALQSIAGDGARLVVSVDCGITAVEEAAAARTLGLDLIVCDHHELPADGAPLPEAILVHPRVPGSAYPFGDLCGAGVAFKLAWQVARVWCGSDRVGAEARDTLVGLLPLVALGTIADVVPLLDENRVLTSFGLSMMRSSSIVGLAALIEAAQLAGERIDDEKVGFVLAPRLNACGRMGHARDAVELLTTDEPEPAAAIAKRLTGMNRDRQRTERRIVETAAEMAEAAGMTAPDHRVIVLADPEWHPGVIGIVCSRLVERFGRPVVLLQQDGDVLRGSARSIEGYSIHAGLAACAAHLERFGGHEAAAGLTMAADRLEAFRRDLVAHANAHITEAELVPRLRIDCAAAIGEFTAETVRDVARLGPFGRGHRRPAVLLPSVRLESVRTMGADGRHLELRVRERSPAPARSGDGDSARRAPAARGLRAVWFGGAESLDRLLVGSTLDLVVEPRLNRWQGRTSVEGLVRDVRVVGAESSLDAQSSPSAAAPAPGAKPSISVTARGRLPARER